MVVLLSHNGFDVDRKLAARVEGIDVILTAHTHDALPRPTRVGNTLLVASGLARQVPVAPRRGGGRRARRATSAYGLIPVLADAIAPDPEHGRADRRTSARRTRPCWAPSSRSTEGLLYRRGTFSGTLDDLICDAMLAERDAEIALSPGFRWGAHADARPGR